MAGPGDHVGVGVVAEEPADRRRERLGVVWRHEQPRHAVLDDLGDAADVRGHDRPRQRHRLEDREALRLAVRRQHGHVERRGHRRDVVAAAGEDDPVGDAELARLLDQRLMAAPLADDEQPRVGAAAEHRRPGVEERRVALLGLESGDDTGDQRLGWHPVLLAERATRLLMVVALEIDPVVDEVDRRAGAELGVDLVLDRPADRDEGVHLRGQDPERLAIFGRADPRRVDRRDDPRPGTAGGREGEDGLRPDDLGPEHVVVDDVGRDGGEVRRERADRDGVVVLVDDRDRDADPLELAGARSRRERDDADVVAGSVEAADQVEDVLLGAAVGPGRHDLDDPDALGARKQRPHRRREAGIVGSGRAHLSSPFVGRAAVGWVRPARPTRTCTARRRGGSRAGGDPRRGPARRAGRP